MSTNNQGTIHIQYTNKWKLNMQASDILQQTSTKFGEYLKPTILTRNQFGKLFKSKRTVGEGAFGSIKCVENCYHEEFAIKESKDSEETYGNYREAAIMKKFNHPNILKIIGFYKIKQTQKLIVLTEFCKFKSLRNFQSFLQNMSEFEKLRLALEIFNGINAIHQKNIMHRDLKPENVLIDEERHAKICDFGFCRYDKEDDLEKSRRIGTPFYNSPETDKGVYTKKCDIFSYGLIVYFIFSNGKNLFRKYTTNEQLKSTRKEIFKIGPAAYKQLNAPDRIKELLINTITEKEEKRFDTRQVRMLWQRFVKQNKLEGLVVGVPNNEEYTGRYDNSILTSESKTTNLLSRSQLMIARVIKLDAQNFDQLKLSRKMLKCCQKISQITLLMTDFKKVIEQVQLSKVQKHLLTYGCLFILEITLENILAACNKFLSTITLVQGNELGECVENVFQQVLKKKEQLSVIIVKVANYLQLAKCYFTPQDLLKPIAKSFDEVKKLQNYLKEICQPQGMQRFKKYNQVESNRDIYCLIESKYKPQVNFLEFGSMFDDIYKKYHRFLPNDHKQEQRKKIVEILDRILKMKIFSS